MPGMSKRERMKAALTGKPVDRPPVAFWRHWPIDDQDADALARATFDYQRKYDWDFMKDTFPHLLRRGLRRQVGVPRQTDRRSGSCGSSDQVH